MPTPTRSQFECSCGTKQRDQSWCFCMSIIQLISKCPGPDRKPKLFTCHQEAVAVVINPDFKMGKNCSGGGIVTQSILRGDRHCVSEFQLFLKAHLKLGLYQAMAVMPAWWVPHLPLDCHVWVRAALPLPAWKCPCTAETIINMLKRKTCLPSAPAAEGFFYSF